MTYPTEARSTPYDHLGTQPRPLIPTHAQGGVASLGLAKLIRTYRSGDEMEPVDFPSGAQEAKWTPPPDATRQRGSWLRWIPLTLATLWLIVSTIVGVKLIQSEPAEVSALNVPTPTLSASSDHVFYGGDAYTGIQNAASDTEHAVVEGVNELAKFQLALQRSVAEQDSKRSSNIQSEIQQGLGYIVIGLGVLTFIVALTRTRGFQ